MMQSSPFKSGEFYHLSRANIQASSYKFGVTSLESDRWITCRDDAPDGTGQLTVVDVPNNFSVSKKPNKAEAAIMHLTQNIIALKAKDKESPGEKYILQIYDLDKKTRLKSVDVNEKVEFWKWINNSKLGIVTAGSVYYISVQNESEGLVKLFDRVGTLSSGCQVISLALDPQEKWSVLTAISSPDGGKTINGHIQLNLLGAEVKNQILEGHCCCFGEAYVHSAQHKSYLFSYFERKAGESTSKILFSEVGTPPEGKSKFKTSGDIAFASDKPNDFPIYMQISAKHGVLYVITKFGFYLIYEIATASCIGKGKLCDDPIFVGTRHSESDGVIVINKKGSVIGLKTDQNALVPHIINQCKHIPNNIQVAIKLAANYKLPGTEKLLEEEFNKAFVQGDYKGAAAIVADCVGLRTQETIQKFKSAPGQPGQSQPIAQYFQVLLEKVKLNSYESIELVGPVLKQGRLNFVEDWLNTNKIECSEALGDLIKPFSNDLALKIYKQCNSSSKLMTSMMEAGNFNEALQFANQSGIKPDYIGLIRSTCSTNPESALTLAKQACKSGQVPVHAVAEIFLQFNRIPELTAFVVEAMRDNRPEDASLQTKVLELNLMAAPHVAETIFQMNVWSQFNKQKIALLCEQKGLPQRALENYTDIKDIRRCILNTNPANINQEWLGTYLTRIQSDWTLQILQDLLRQSRQNLSVCVQIAIANHTKLGTENVIKVFDGVSAYEGVYYFLGAILKDTEDQELYFKYIEAAAKCNQLKDVERIIRESKHYDPVRVKDFLKEIRLADPKPLIYLCDIHGFVDELTKYLVKNGYNKFIEIYIFKVNPAASPTVLGTLVDLEVDENYIKQILYNLRGNCPVDELVAEFEKRNKLRVIENWLESRVSEGNQTPSIHNALAKIYIDTNKDPQTFLANNPYYDSKLIGHYCEDRDPHLALTAYKRAWGSCDNELIELTNKNALYRLQAKYLVERQSKELWMSVLSPDNPHRKWIIEQVVSSALPDSKNVEEVSTTVQAFMAADLPLELIGLLEKIVLHNSTFSGYKKLQNLLIITAMKADKTKVMDFINRLDNYDGPEIARVALGEEYQLYEEAFVIYKRNKLNVEAIEVLINNIESLPRAAEFADKTNEPAVWSKLAKAYLDNNLVAESIESYLKANDPSMYLPVIQAAEREEKYEQLIKYLIMARQQVKDARIDTELCYSLARAGKNNDLEVFITTNNSADIAKVGDRCFDDKLYEAAKILFISIKNNSKIASCLIMLKQFQQAIEACNKANNPKTWKELCKACVAAGDFKIATTAGLNVIVHSDLLDEIILHYEKYGVPDQAINLLETGKGLKGKGALKSIITELGVLYAKYQPEKVMELIKHNFEDIIETKLLRVCERFLLWAEVAYLYSRYNEYDNAINIMIEHSPYAWDHGQFVSLIQKIRNIDLHYKAALFYLDEQPMLLNDLLKSLATTIDLTKIVSVMRKTAYLPLITPFLKSVQSANNQAVNEALNQIHLQNEDFEELRRSVTQYENFDPIHLAKETENHEIVEFRRISAYLYRKIGKYAESIVLSKQDEEYRDCIETALESGTPELIEDLMKFFIKKKDNEFFVVTLYTCYEYIRPDVVLELAWRFGLLEFAMPYFVQVARELTYRVENVQKKAEERDRKEEKQAQQQMNQPLDIVGDYMMPILPGLNPGMLMLTMEGANPFGGGPSYGGGGPGFGGGGGPGFGGGGGPGFGGGSGPGFGGGGGPGFGPGGPGFGPGGPGFGGPGGPGFR